jgi:putative transposase
MPWFPTVFSIHLHIVWISKYRRKILHGEIAELVRGSVREFDDLKRIEVKLMTQNLSNAT